MNKKNVTIASLGFPAVALADTAPTLVTTTGQVVAIFCGLVNWIFWVLIILSVIMALVASYRYTTASGDPEKVSKATKTLTYAAIGVVVAIVAKGFPSIISSLLTGNEINGCAVANSTVNYPTQ